MKRDLYAMTRRTHDVLVIGGGITGACIARDAALRGLSVALVDKGDFAGASSAASSKLIHGGLRYLQNLELGLVRDALRERRIWSNVAPHMVSPLTFLMPTTDRRIRERLKLALGLTAYDWLAYDRHRVTDQDKSIPGHNHLSREEVLALEPGLASDALTGAMLFYDYQMHSPERLALECILSAVTHGAQVANYAEVVDFMREGSEITGVRVRDRATSGGECVVNARVTINAAGPWADILMGTMTADKQTRHLIRSMGIHLITRPLTQGHGIAIPLEHSHFFILPWRNHSIVGTTDKVYEGHPDDFRVGENDILELLHIVNEGYPAAQLSRSDVLYFYGGLRPIVDATTSAWEEEEEVQGGDKDSYTASRAAEVYDHEGLDGVRNTITAIGGQWTTARHLAEEVVNLTVEKLGLDPILCTTEDTPTYGGYVGPFADFLGRVKVKYSAFPPALIMHLAENYGSHLDDVLEVAMEPDAQAPLAEGHADIEAQVRYAARHEMALTVEDVLFRRTGLGTLGMPGEATIERVADVMAHELSWDGAERTAQIARAKAAFLPWVEL